MITYWNKYPNVLISDYPATYLSLYSDDEELQGKAQDVAGVKAVPNS